MSDPTPTEESTWLDIATDAARAAGDELVRRLPATRDIRWKTYAGERTVVTDADFAADRAIRHVLSNAFPDHVIFSEEFPHDDISGPNVWVVDPLDGTDNYSRGQPQFCVSVAHASYGQVDAGVVFDPVRNEMFTAIRNGHAHLNNTPINVSPYEDPAHATITWAQRGISPDDSQNFTDSLAQAARTFHRVRMTGSAALEIVWVAAGRYDGALYSNVKWWDHAAGTLIIMCAGGRATDLFSVPVGASSRRCVFSNGSLHEEIIGIAHEYRLHEPFKPTTG